MWMILTAALAMIGASQSDQAAAPAIEPAAAIAAADANRAGRHGRFVMAVRSTGKSRKATYLNSTDDYRSPDGLTFRLAPAVAGALMRRYGVPAEEYLQGRRVVVDGIVRRIPIVNREYGRTKSFNRWAHQVYVQRLGQVVSVE